MLELEFNKKAESQPNTLPFYQRYPKTILVVVLGMFFAYMTFAFVIFGLWVKDFKQETKACQAFWHEQCEFHAVPKSGAEGFTVDYYNKVKTADGSGL